MRNYIPRLLLLLLVMAAETATIVSLTQARPVVPTQVALCPSYGVGPTYMSVASVAEPRRLVLACGTKSVGLLNLKWKNWGMPEANATGMFWWNSCIPSCASKHFEVVAATIDMGKTTHYAGVNFYTKMLIDTPSNGVMHFEQYPPTTWVLFPWPKG